MITTFFRNLQAGIEHAFRRLSRVGRIVQHVLAEIALGVIGAGGGVGALDVAVLATGNIFGRAWLDVVGAAEDVVVLVQRRIERKRLAALEAAGKQGSEQQQRDAGYGTR